MKIEFTTNALARMLDRGIREAEVESAIRSPDHLGPCLEKCWHARKRMQTRTLEVMFTRDLARIHVRTVYWQDVVS